jgi:hypothetical protein
LPVHINNICELGFSNILNKNLQPNDIWFSGKITQNKQFLFNDFYDADRIKIEKTNVDIVNKLQEITCINERRYVEDDLNLFFNFDQFDVKNNGLPGQGMIPI